MPKLHLFVQRFLSDPVRLRWSRSRLERSFAKAISAAKKAKDFEKAEGLEADARWELGMQQEEEDAYASRRLLRKARRLRVPIPPTIGEDGDLTDAWEEGTYFGGFILSDAGYRTVREEVRREEKARHENRAHYVVWITALTGVIGAITGLVAVSLGT